MYTNILRISKNNVIYFTREFTKFWKLSRNFRQVEKQTQNISIIRFCVEKLKVRRNKNVSSFFFFLNESNYFLFELFQTGTAIRVRIRPSQPICRSRNLTNSFRDLFFGLREKIFRTKTFRAKFKKLIKLRDASKFGPSCDDFRTARVPTST